VTGGDLLRVSHGVYVDATAPPSAHRSLVEAAVAVPKGVVCLLSALRFHGLGTQSPHEVWVAIDVKAWKPRTELPIHIVRFSGRALTYGVETHEIEGVKVRVTAVAKTVADCFKYRNKIGVDVAVEALRAIHQRKLASVDDIMRAAKICRVANVMRPYLEALS
jgi:predicted transcriptional regulator of viral defense system